MTASERPSQAVALAASAGGIAALSAVLRSLPADLDAAVFVLLHLSPSHKSRLAEVLAKVSNLPVETAKDGTQARSGTVYVAPPNRHLAVTCCGKIRLLDEPRQNFARPSAEPLFHSVALAYHQHATLVVLTGFGRNGSDSLPAAHALGAFVIAQDPATAYAPGMPSAAIASGAVDEILPLEAIGAWIEKRVEANLACPC